MLSSGLGRQSVELIRGSSNLLIHPKGRKMLGIVWNLLTILCGVLGAKNIADGIHLAMKGNWGLAIIDFAVGLFCLSAVVRWAITLKKLEKKFNSGEADEE